MRLCDKLERLSPGSDELCQYAGTRVQVPLGTANAACNCGWVCTVCIAAGAAQK